MKDRANIPVKKSTRDALLKVKLKKQGTLGRKLTWDELLLGSVKSK